MDTALDLHERLPALGAALDKGVLDLRRARTINMGTSHVDQATARMVTDRILDTAAKSITGQIAARLRKLCITINPDNARSEYHTGLDDRRLWTEMNPDGTANLHGYNLAPLCRHDHQLKHDRWALTRQPNGDHTWTSPPGHTSPPADHPPRPTTRPRQNRTRFLVTSTSHIKRNQDRCQSQHQRSTARCSRPRGPVATPSQPSM